MGSSESLQTVFNYTFIVSADMFDSLLFLKLVASCLFRIKFSTEMIMNSLPLIGTKGSSRHDLRCNAEVDWWICAVPGNG